MPNVINTSARVNAHFLFRFDKCVNFLLICKKFPSKLENLKFCSGLEIEKFSPT